MPTLTYLHSSTHSLPLPHPHIHHTHSCSFTLTRLLSQPSTTIHTLIPLPSLIYSYDPPPPHSPCTLIFLHPHSPILMTLHPHTHHAPSYSFTLDHSPTLTTTHHAPFTLTHLLPQPSFHPHIHHHYILSPSLPQPYPVRSKHCKR